MKKNLVVEISYSEHALTEVGVKNKELHLSSIRVVLQGILLETARTMIEVGFSRESVIQVMQEQGLPYPVLRQIDQHPKGADVPGTRKQ